MARSVEQINQYIVATLVTNFAAAGITIDPTIWSRRNLLRNLCFTFAVGQNLLEQLQDLFLQTVEDTVAKAYAGSAPWLQDKMFKFQYDATNPQVVALVNLIPTYPVVDPTLRIITACSVTSDTPLEVLLKVAKSNPFQALSGPEIDSAQGYVNIVGIEGINYVVVSLNSDKLYIAADIFFQGQYSAVIQADVIAAIVAYLQNLSVINFNGSLKMADLEEVIRVVPGVNDVVLKNVRGRADVDLFSAGIDLILDTAIIQRQFFPVAGYIGQETDTGHTFADSLNFIPE